MQWQNAPYTFKSAAGGAWIGVLAGFLLASIVSAVPGPAFGQSAWHRPTRPLLILGRKHPGHIMGLSPQGISVDLKDGGAQVVQFAEIWRIRRAFASDEPPGTAVIDFANNRLFVATPVSYLVENVGRKIPLTKLTAPNGEAIYIAAGKVTDIANALPGLHNPASKTVIGTRDGTQQVIEPPDEAKRIIAEAHITE
ncbi:MAG TPA: hypothetical protein VE986_03340 [Hyphomicrobiales bacterium]|nr:hypothetical protein [Hyphomicrobiales bacterium]